MSIQIAGKSKVVIVVEANATELNTRQMISALKQAIASTHHHSVTVEVITNQLFTGFNGDLIESVVAKDVIICPLTLNLPANLNFAADAVYQACRDVPHLRQRVAQELGYWVGDGYLWLPVVLTAKGPLYGEAIQVSDLRKEKISNQLILSSCSYDQPFHISDAKRQQLYQLGKSVLQLLSATPATYLIQFGFQDTEICFDRLFPFPAAPAIASLGVQEPDLFACHWRCLINQPITDLTIISTALT